MAKSAAYRLAIGIGSEPVEHVNRDGDALISRWDEVMRTVEAAFDVPEQMLRTRTVNRTDLGRWQTIMVRIAQRVRLECSALLFVVEHESTVDKLDVIHVVRWTSTSQNNNDLVAGWYEGLRRNESTQIIARFSRCWRAYFEQWLLVIVGVDVDYLNDAATWWWSGKGFEVIKIRVH